MLCFLVDLTVNCPSTNAVVRSNGRLYAVSDIILSGCLQYAYQINEIAVNYDDDKVKLITEKYHIIYERLYRCYQLTIRVMCPLDCIHIDELTYAPSKKHSFNGKEYVKCEYF